MYVLFIMIMDVSVVRCSTENIASMPIVTSNMYSSSTVLSILENRFFLSVLFMLCSFLVFVFHFMVYPCCIQQGVICFPCTISQSPFFQFSLIYQPVAQADN